MPYDQLPKFFQEKALRFLILPNARSGAVRLARIREIDFTNGIWTIAPEPGRKFLDREFRVALSKEAGEALRSPNLDDDPDALVFSNEGNRLHENAINDYLKDDMGVSANVAVPHGFRSAFEDWAHDRTNFPAHIIDAAMGHREPDKTKRAYRRSDAIEQRRTLMETWAKYIMSPAPDGKVVPLQRKSS